MKEPVTVFLHNRWLSAKVCVCLCVCVCVCVCTCAHVHLWILMHVSVWYCCPNVTPSFNKQKKRIYGLNLLSICSDSTFVPLICLHCWQEVHNTILQMMFESYGTKRGALHGVLVSAPYVTKDHLQLKRFQAQSSGTTYVYDYPEMFRQVFIERQKFCVCVCVCLCVCVCCFVLNVLQWCSDSAPSAPLPQPPTLPIVSNISHSSEYLVLITYGLHLGVLDLIFSLVSRKHSCLRSSDYSRIWLKHCFRWCSYR